MTTHVVADGITAKRKPTVDEMEVLLTKRIPDLIRRCKEGGLNPSGVNTTLQMVLEGLIITESQMVVVVPPKPKPDKFEFINSFEVTVPEGYDHATRLDTFKAAHESEFYYYNPNIVDANYGKATTKLVPRQKFLVKAFGVKRGKSVTSEECMVKLRFEKATLVGAQGVSLVYEQKKEELTKGRWSLSFDEKENLPFVGGGHGVSGVGRYSDGAFDFSFDRWEGGWHDRCVLLAFCEL